jgi:hypothetical protein
MPVFLDIRENTIRKEDFKGREESPRREGKKLTSLI